MNLCIGTTKASHDEVCYEDVIRNCPLCALVGQQEALYDKISDLEDKVRNLEETA